jgi:hypothetical protein
MVYKQIYFLLQLSNSEQTSSALQVSLKHLWKLLHENILCYIRFEVFMAVTVKNAVFWDVASCRSCVSRRFGRNYRLYLHGMKIRERVTRVSRWLQSEPHPVGVFDRLLSLQPPTHSGYSLADFHTMKIEAILSSETSVRRRSTRRHIPEDGVLHFKL